MSHVPHETLWSLARAELPEDAAADARAHLALCSECQAAFGDVQSALDVLSVLPEPPPMPEAMARRVGLKLAEELDQRAAKGLRPWWATLFSPRLVLVGALGVVLAVVAAYVVTRPAPADTPAPIATQQTPPPAPEVAPPPVPELPKTPKKKLTATVASAKKARAGDQTAAKAQVLAEGAVVKTEKGGSLWMKLPDGTSAGLTSQSQVTLAKLEEKELMLDVAGGSVAMVVPHREDRVLTVRAGDVEVKDLGTRFLVSREVNRVLVAVEEGSVEVKTPSSTQTVQAGRAVAWRDGKLESMPWAAREEAPAGKTTSSAAKLTEEEDETPPVEAAVEDEPVDIGPPPPPPESGDPDSQWDTPSGFVRPPSEPVAPGQPPPPPPNVTSAHPPAAGPPARRRRGGGFNLGELERRIREFTREVQKPFQQLDRRVREQQAVDVARLADAGDCEGSLALANAWLKDTNRAADADAVRRGVLLQKMRCLNHLGRTAEAEAVRLELEQP
ncbi:MAG: FecR family protein [Myxococcota bacterium]